MTGITNGGLAVEHGARLRHMMTVEGRAASQGLCCLTPSARAWRLDAEHIDGLGSA